MAFKKYSAEATAVDTPEELFNDLKSKRTIPGLMAHQADVLRAFCEQAIEHPDVAIQLPTGSGKTLVGLLLGEWRRIRFGERVVYLCPTNQLVYQVAEQASGKYGIKVRTFVGAKSGYDINSKNDYESAEAVAVTSYSGLFNINPYFDAPNLIILDDAHAAEHYIASNWTLNIDRKEHSALYTALAGVLKSVIPGYDHKKLVSEESTVWDTSWVDKLPTPIFDKIQNEILNVIDEYATEGDLKYRWALIRENLSACNFYIAATSFLVRPLLPPTNTHEPFRAAKQRIYMSATLGEGGELERIVGRAEIKRLKVPEGWDKQGIGRRFFIFPQRSMAENELAPLMGKFLKSVERSIIIVPKEKNRVEFQEWARKSLHLETFDAKQIETTKQPFVDSKNAVAIIANRYDGIDFPDNECRLLFIAGLPLATNLQEQFIISRMGAVVLYNDRILTRLLQAFGRCTRTPTDFSAVVITGNELTKYLMAKDRRSFLHPEMQAELEFGIQQSKDAKETDFVENLKIFLDHNKEWENAESQIIALRKTMTKKTLDGTDELKAIVKHEVQYQYALWNKNFMDAFESARNVLGGLKHPSLKGYRALWSYLAGSAAYLATRNEQGNIEDIAKECYENAMKATNSIKWLADLAKRASISSIEGKGENDLLTLIERIEILFEDMGTTHNQTFDKEEKKIIEGLNSNKSKQFEAGQKLLGRWIGYDSGKTESQGSPDPYWIVDENMCFVFEDFTDTDENPFICITKARQACTHPNWIRENIPLEKDAKIIPILVSATKKVDREALVHLKDVLIWPIDDFRKWAHNSLAIIREVRKSFDGIGNLNWRADVAREYNKHVLGPKALYEHLKNNTPEKILISK